MEEKKSAVIALRTSVSVAWMMSNLLFTSSHGEELKVALSADLKAQGGGGGAVLGGRSVCGEGYSLSVPVLFPAYTGCYRHMFILIPSRVSSDFERISTQGSDCSSLRSRLSFSVSLVSVSLCVSLSHSHIRTLTHACGVWLSLPASAFVLIF